MKLLLPFIALSLLCSYSLSCLWKWSLSDDINNYEKLKAQTLKAFSSVRPTSWTGIVQLICNDIILMFIFYKYHKYATRNGPNPANPVLGTGLTLSEGKLSVDAAQPQISSVGMLRDLSVSGTTAIDGPISITNRTESSSVSTGSLIVSGGGVGVSGSVFIGENVSVARDSAFSGKVTVPSPKDMQDATTKSYVDSASYLIAGAGITLSGATVSVGEDQSQITSVGTLKDLSVLGPMSISGAVGLNDDTPSTSSSSGSLVVAKGGIGVAGSVYIGKNLSVAGNVVDNIKDSRIRPVMEQALFKLVNPGKWTEKRPNEYPPYTSVTEFMQDFQVGLSLVEVGNTYVTVTTTRPWCDGSAPTTQVVYAQNGLFWRRSNYEDTTWTTWTKFCPAFTDL